MTLIKHQARVALSGFSNVGFFFFESHPEICFILDFSVQKNNKKNKQTMKNWAAYFQGGNIWFVIVCYIDYEVRNNNKNDDKACWQVVR